MSCVAQSPDGLNIAQDSPIRMSGGLFLKKGTYGCVFSPALNSVEGRAHPSADTVGKVFTNHGDAEDEVLNANLFRAVDAAGRYGVYAFPRIEHVAGVQSELPSELSKCAHIQRMQGAAEVTMPRGVMVDKSIHDATKSLVVLERYMRAIANLFDGAEVYAQHGLAHCDIKLDNAVMDAHTLHADHPTPLKFIDFGMSMDTTHAWMNADALAVELARTRELELAERQKDPTRWAGVRLDPFYLGSPILKHTIESKVEVLENAYFAWPVLTQFMCQHAWTGRTPFLALTPEFGSVPGGNFGRHHMSSSMTAHHVLDARDLEARTWDHADDRARYALKIRHTQSLPAQLQRAVARYSRGSDAISCLRRSRSLPPPETPESIQKAAADRVARRAEQIYGARNGVKRRVVTEAAPSAPSAHAEPAARLMAAIRSIDMYSLGVLLAHLWEEFTGMSAIIGEDGVEPRIVRGVLGNPYMIPQSDARHLAVFRFVARLVGCHFGRGEHMGQAYRHLLTELFTSLAPKQQPPLSIFAAWFGDWGQPGRFQESQETQETQESSERQAESTEKGYPRLVRSPVKHRIGRARSPGPRATIRPFIGGRATVCETCGKPQDNPNPDPNAY